ncbi:hypothetical protein CRBSH125_21430 [Afipia carboxidovorans]|nr:hypothetical protein CRBSH125_21430 [Afipia carboxidovorans]
MPEQTMLNWMLCVPNVSPVKGVIVGNLQSTGPGTGFAPLVSGVTSRHRDAGVGSRRDDGETHFPLQSGRRPVTAAGTTALSFETVPKVIDLEKYARAHTRSRKLRTLHHRKPAAATSKAMPSDGHTLGSPVNVTP